MNTMTKFTTLLMSIVGAVLLLTAAPAKAAERSLSFAVAGVVAEVPVTVGTQVKKGDVLAVLDLRPFKADKKAADAQVQAAGIVRTLTAKRRQQVQELFDSLATSVEEVEKAEIAAAEAVSAFEQATADAAVSAWNLERASLRSPFAGTVSALPGYPGMVVNPAAEIVPVVVVNGP